MAVIVALSFDSIIIASTNNLMVFLSAFLAVVWLVTWLKVSIPSLGLILTNFLVVFMLGGGMSPMPVQSFSTTLTNIYSVLSGIILATVLWVIDQSLRTVESIVEKSVQKKPPTNPPTREAAIPRPDQSPAFLFSSPHPVLPEE